MKRKYTLLLAAVCWLWFLQLQSQEKNEFQYYRQLYNKAEILFNGTATDSTDAVALNYYSRIITRLQPDALNAAMLYNCCERSGILKQGLGYAPEEILKNFYAALDLHKTYHLSDSVLFRLLLSAGNVHYTKGFFDSSVYYFSWAEKIINRYPAAGLAGDLYNSLGALYNEAGNYVQSGIYFSKALELTRQQHPELGEAIFAMSANIASAVRSAGYTDSALFLYKQLLHTANPSVAIIKNISEIYVTKNEPDSALQYLQILKNTNGFYAISIQNAFAKAFILKNDTLQAAAHLRTAVDLYKSITPQVKNNQYAAAQKNFGDLLMLEKKPLAALPYYQQAIIQFNFKFNDSNAFANPGNFIGDFASYNLFNALTAKAACFAQLYKNKKNSTYFNAAISTYDSAFALSDYIKKTIDNDDARLFIADKVFDAYNKAINFLMTANSNQSENEIIHTLEWISKSRAASLAISLKENTVKRYAGLPDSLLQKEKNCRLGISRLKLQLQQTADTAEQIKLISAINTALLQLQLIDNRFKEFSNYYKQRFAASTIDIRSMQQHILNNKTAVVCYFKGADKLYAFIIKQNAIIKYEITSDLALENNIDAYTRQLTLSSAGKAYNESAGRYLYARLMQPLISALDGIISLVIIPDQNLINVPFEAFQPAAGDFLIQHYAITYQYALPFLQKNTAVFNEKKAVAFAPFASGNIHATMNALPSSVNEIAHFSKASQLINNAATKNKFIDAAPGASVIHLATHAAVNFREPENSYIAFYQQNNADSGYKMFAHELYNLELPNLQLVFLSACETGSGKVSRSEGALSISRAFAFAGCPNIVTSLWKAEDKSTAYISGRFYTYIAKGYTYAQALQKAKTDLLADAAMSQYHSPIYWSHLIFIGDVQEEKPAIWFWTISAGVIVFAALMILYKRKKRI